MKKTLIMFVIVLTFCSAASVAIAAMSLEEAKRDTFYFKRTADFVLCVLPLAEKEAFSHATSSALFAATRERAGQQCRTLARLKLLRLCELRTDPQIGPMPESGCAGGQHLENAVDDELDWGTGISIDSFDKKRSEKGLPPRPSFDK